MKDDEIIDAAASFSLHFQSGKDFPIGRNRNYLPRNP